MVYKGQWQGINFIDTNQGVNMFISDELQQELNVNQNEEHFRVSCGVVFTTIKKALKYSEAYMKAYPTQPILTIFHIKPVKILRRETPPIIIEDVK